MRKTLLFIPVSLLLFFGCTSYESLLNYNQTPKIPTDPQVIANYNPLKIQANDILKIQVSSTDIEAAKPFNVEVDITQAQQGANNNYLVNSEGFIIFPTIGKIEVAGLELEEATEKIRDLVRPYFNENPIVQLRLVNFKVNVNGEVTRPGSFSVINDRLTIIEAVTLAGDFTPYSRRDSILIIRESEGLRSFGYIDFNSAAIFESPYFYLQQNDVIYVRPEKTKVNSVRDPATRFLPWISAIASITAIVISISR